METSEIYLHEPRTEKICGHTSDNFCESDDFIIILILLFLLLLKGKKNQPDSTD